MESWEGNMDTVKGRQNISVLMGFEPWMSSSSVELQCQDALSMGDIQSLKSEGHIQSLCVKNLQTILLLLHHMRSCVTHHTFHI